MIIPSIDLSGGQTVQLIGGDKRAIEAGDPVPIAEKFRLAGEIAVIDIDAARGTGSNAHLVEKLIRIAPCRVGGGIRDVDTALRWLDKGAEKVILGTAAQPEILSKLPRSRTIAALDTNLGHIVTHGWTHNTGVNVTDRIMELRDVVGGFLVTTVEREGRMEGPDLPILKKLADLAGKRRLTLAGGFTTAREIAYADKVGVDAQVGMSLYTGKLNLADAISAPLESDRADGLFATVVCDEHSRALGLAWSDRESIRNAVESGQGVYNSRSRGIWFKGSTSGATQDLLRIDLDCDRDALRFTVRQHGTGFCHQGAYTCWGPSEGLSQLARTILSRVADASTNSYTRKLLEQPELLNSKLQEEASELAEANSREAAIHETADLFYFALTAAARNGVSLHDVERELDRRSKMVFRRHGSAKSDN